MAAPLLLADVPWLLYRSYFALPRSIRGAGDRPVNALLGTVNTMLSLALGEGPAAAPRAVVGCVGAEEAAYRVALYPPYHAHRDPMPEELADQWQRAPALLRALGWSVAEAGELEADDAIYSLALAEEARGGRSLLLTGDRDLYAAVTSQTVVVELGKGGAIGEIGPDEVRRRYGIGPELVTDLIALRGDPSDGIPGAPGIGAKTAAELLREHGSLEGVLAAALSPLPPMRPRLVSILREHAGQLRVFREVAALQRLELEPPPDTPTDLQGGAAAAEKLGMRRLAERLAALAARAGA